MAPPVKVAFAALLLLALPAAAQQPITFGQALESLERDNPSLAASAFAVQGARAQAGEARSRRWPTVALEGQAVFFSDPVVLEFEGGSITFPDTPLPTLPLPNTIVELDRDRYESATASLKQPLYAGGRIRAGIVAADAAVGAAEQEDRADQARLVLELVKRYFGQRLADQAVDVRTATVESLVRHLKDARLLEREGQISRAEQLRAEVALSEAKRELGDARRTASLARSALAALLASDVELQPTTSIPLAAPVLPLEQWLRQAQAGNPKLQQAAFQRVRAQQGIRAVRGEYAPSVGLFALTRLYDRDSVIEQPGAAVGVSVSMPLFDGFQRRHKLEAAQAKLGEIEARQEAGQRDVALLVEQRYEQLGNAQDQLASYESTRRLAEESLRAQTLAFSEGLAGSLDVVDAELSLARLRLGIHSARYDALVALAGLLEATGDMERVREITALAAPEQGE